MTTSRKVANHLDLDISNIKSYDKLCNYIENHLNYSPPSNNKRYYELESEYYKLEQEYLKIKDTIKSDE